MIGTTPRGKQEEAKALPAKGYNVRYRIAPDKLYSSWQVHGASEQDVSINEGSGYYIAVDAFNENGVTPGTPIFVK